jgi:hypothetical protein
VVDIDTAGLYRLIQRDRLKTEMGVSVTEIEDAAALADCIAPLDSEQRRALHAYWDQVIREEWVPPVRPATRAVSLGELDERRERREARRAVSAVARLAPRRVGVASGPEAA